MTIIIKIQSEISLAGACPARYRGIATDGCWFFLTQQGSQEVTRLDSCFRAAECFPTCRCYTCLCYDPCACCFWASDGRCPSVLYQLDENFREVDLIQVRDIETGVGVGMISGISYDCEEKCLLLAAAAGLVWVSVRGGEGLVTCIQKSRRWITGVVAAGHGYFFCYFAKGRQRLRHCLKSGETLWECSVPKNLFVTSAVFAQSPDARGECRLFALASKRYRYSRLLECVPAEGAFCPGLCCFCKPKPPCPDPKVCADLLESVAQAQTALAGILSAEGEKLLKVIAATDDPDTLLQVNRAVSRTLVDATFLEQVLYQKLESIRAICGPCKPEPKDACCD